MKNPIKEISYHNFYPSEDKIVRRNKSFTEILSYDWKGSRGR